jgi:hypothetical protein
VKSNTKNFFAASLLFFITTTYTTSTTILRSALDNDALRRVVAVAIRRARRVRRGEINHEQRSCENINITSYHSLLSHTFFVVLRRAFGAAK